MYVAPALAASSACVALKQRVTFVLMPSAVNVLTALMPSLMSGTFTTMLSWIFASARPSRRIPS